MNRVLIAASDLISADGIQSALAANGFQTARVMDCVQLVEFCRQHSPDLTVIDFEIPGGSFWAAVKAIRQDPRLVGMPIVGVGSLATDQERQYAMALGVVAAEPKPVALQNLVLNVRRALQLAVPATNVTPMPQSPAPSAAPSGHDPVSRLLDLIREIRGLTVDLKPGVATYGEEGPELFEYIENSGNQILAALTRISADGPERSSVALQDKDLRHDFRNMIGSVTGFSELLLMEPSVLANGPTQAKFKRIRELCRAFCDLLDEQKAAAA